MFMETPSILSIFVVIFCSLNIIIVTVEATWCVVRSDASAQALQRGLDYACSYGADCVPIQSSGLCYLPNTIQNHASYAYNSFYQRKNEAPGSCGFSGTATIAKTDPSYGSCVYPASPRAAGGLIPPEAGGRNNTSGEISTIPVLYPPPPTNINAVYGNGSDIPNSQDSKATSPKFWTMASLVPGHLMLLFLHIF
ncbi:glucan endo-1,3-beta-glucosidase 4-like [Nicotiana tabacum]|uniref:Glucan endo-1,3-beta-glucosidase 4-like n=2 Tax=Nicotiana TaxID=4085 RepID=A0A1S4CMQ9_TOBAC|nr:PREDICTED: PLASMODESMATA CALLOSE-BINDING PROTEIN 3-like [Nicotiana sylvestris]XP_016502244.1 PREDICTED: PLASMODESMATA CALLOSE-BINDING PROTEIN 3-like [Nicotiana tabacum]